MYIYIYIYIYMEHILERTRMQHNEGLLTYPYREEQSILRLGVRAWAKIGRCGCSSWDSTL